GPQGEGRDRGGGGARDGPEEHRAGRRQGRRLPPQAARDDRGARRRAEGLGELRHRRRRNGEGRGVIVLGIDPGTATTGYGVVKGDGRELVSLVECGVIRTRPRDPLSARLREIYDGVAELLARHKPDALSVEDVFYAKNVRTTVVLGHARGVVLLAGEQAGVAIHELPPAELKKAVVGT